MCSVISNIHGMLSKDNLNKLFCRLDKQGPGRGIVTGQRGNVAAFHTRTQQNSF
jgi:hypothetical protein